MKFSLNRNTILASFILFIFVRIPVYSMPPIPDTEFQLDTVPVVKTVSGQPVYTTQRLSTSRPVIDGKLDDECWKKGTWGGHFHQFTPNEGAKPTYPTEFIFSTTTSIFM